MKDRNTNQDLEFYAKVLEKNERVEKEAVRKRWEDPEKIEDENVIRVFS
jgi:hypothetical protein